MTETGGSVARSMRFTIANPAAAASPNASKPSTDIATARVRPAGGFGSGGPGLIRRVDVCRLCLLVTFAGGEP